MWTTNIAWFDEANEEDVFEAHDRIYDLLIDLGAPFDTINTVWLPPNEEEHGYCDCGTCIGLPPLEDKH